MRVVLVGLGGIGSSIADPLCRTMLFSRSERSSRRLILVDGDGYEEGNRSRQRYQALTNKAAATREMLQPMFPELEIEAKSKFIDPGNAFLFIKDGDAVFSAVDNHATRKVISDHVGTLQDCLLISGGNDLYDGNVQLYVKERGVAVTPPLTHLHPEIEFPEDKNPADFGCDEAVEGGSTQILAVNFAIASLMLSAYALWLESAKLPYTEIFFDMKTGNVRPAKRVIDKRRT